MFPPIPGNQSAPRPPPSLIVPRGSAGSKGGFQRIQALFCLHYEFQIEQVSPGLGPGYESFPQLSKKIQNNKWPGRKVEGRGTAIQGFWSHRLAMPEELLSLGPRDKTVCLWPEVRSWDPELSGSVLCSQVRREKGPWSGPQKGESPSLQVLWPLAFSGDKL